MVTVVTYSEVISKSAGESQKVTLNVNLKVLTVLNGADDTTTGCRESVQSPRQAIKCMTNFCCYTFLIACKLVTV